MPAKLEVLTRVNDTPAQTAVVMLHGYGADCQDLAGLQPFLDPELSRDWFFPNGIYGIEEFMGQGRCWFQLSVSRWLEKTGGGVTDFSAIYDSAPEDFAAAKSAVLEFCQSLAGTYSTIAIGGFSQGAMLTTQLLPLLDPAVFNRVVLFSGALINRPAWRASWEQGQQREQQAVFQSHGRSDMVLPFKMGSDLAEELKPYCPHHDFLPFDGGHEIPMPVLSAAKTFLGLA